MKQKHNVTAEKLGIQISSGTLAGLAGGAVTISMGETSLFVSATAAATLRPGQDFFSPDRRLPGKIYRSRPFPRRILQTRRPSE
jgi:hypothetical protein